MDCFQTLKIILLSKETFILCYFLDFAQVGGEWGGEAEIISLKFEVFCCSDQRIKSTRRSQD